MEYNNAGDMSAGPSGMQGVSLNKLSWYYLTILFNYLSKWTHEN